VGKVPAFAKRATLFREDSRRFSQRFVAQIFAQPKAVILMLGKRFALAERENYFVIFVVFVAGCLAFFANKKATKTMQKTVMKKIKNS
jgi:magnesium-transporting ATPase (P-type)